MNMRGVYIFKSGNPGVQPQGKVNCAMHATIDVRQCSHSSSKSIQLQPATSLSHVLTADQLFFRPYLFDS